MGMSIGDKSGNWYNVDNFTAGFTSTDGTGMQEMHKQYQFNFGQLKLHEIRLPDAMVIFGEFSLTESSFNIKATARRDTVEMNFALGGKGVMHNHNNGQQYLFEESHHNMIYNPWFDGTAVYNPGSTCSFFEIHFASSHFLQLSKNSNPALEKFAEQVASGKDAMAGQYNHTITPAMYDCIHHIRNSRFSGTLNTLFLQAKCYELLTLQATAMENTPARYPTSILKNTGDKASIEYARDYLLQNASMPPSLTELAAAAGINTFKLKNGFKEMYNDTVFGYLSKVKLSQSKKLLLSGMAIKEVACQMGYSSVQHFSNAFRKHFGTTPGSIR